MCWQRLFNILLFVTITVGAQIGSESNEAIGGFYPNKKTIGEDELKQVTLDNLDGGIKTKREAENYTEEDIANEINEDKMSDQEANYETSKTIEHLKLPKKKGSPAFSIHAQKVYILYPSLFQDPNIFGRFSIPQNVNLEPSLIKPSTDFDASPASPIQDELSFAESLPSAISKRMTRRQAAAPEGKAPTKEQKKNVETHLTGNIVVLNQDVNEFNRKEAY